MEFELPYHFASQHVPCSSSCGSCSAPSTAGSIQDPFTPPSGRSSPGLLPMMMGHDNVGCGTLGMGITPPGSVFGANFSPNGPESPQYMDLGYNAYPQQLISPPLEFAPPPYSTEAFNQYGGAMPSWAWSENGPSMFLEGDSPAVGMTLGEATPQPSYLSVQEKTAALHQVQGRSRRINRRSKMPVVMVRRGTVSKSRTIPAVLCTTGTHKCPHPDCAQKPPFKRQEHLKRHTKTVHGDQDLVIVICQFCMGRFNRDDNYRTHLRLHTIPGGRTKYFPEAQAVYDDVMRNTKQRRQSQKAAERAAERVERVAILAARARRRGADSRSAFQN
ncbi:hypothetical protein F4824DRAFT_509217 [Ustulina deusta]|nr:hypothetical protein F4824DRAFT_509217 [Ustulina deusta]